MTSLSPEDRAILTAGASMWQTAAIPSASIPSLKLADGPMGVASSRVDERDVSRLTPCATALGASFDVDLVARVGSLVGAEAIDRGVDMLLAPNVNLARSPLAGRAFEYFSEDPLVAGLLGAAWVTGVQSTGTAAAPKHLVCNDSETERDRVNVVVDERTLREVYLLPFELCAAAGAAAMLTAYNKVNGQWCSENGHITGIVKKEWGFTGPLISDWFGTHSTTGSLLGGLDLEMPGPARYLGMDALTAVSSGDVPAARLQDASDRVGNAARRWGASKSPPSLDRDALLIEAAAAGMVLLRNDGILPLNANGMPRRIAVIGPNSTHPCYQGGTFAKIALADGISTPLDAIVKRLGANNQIIHEPGVDPQPRLPSMPVVPAVDLRDGCSQGMTIEYFDGDDISQPPMVSETRDTNSLVWFAGANKLGVFNKSSVIRARGWFTASRDGVHYFYVGATGAVMLRVAGELLYDCKQRLAPKDVMGSLKRGDAGCTEYEMLVGQRVLVEVEFRYDAAHAHGLWYGIREPDSYNAMFDRAIAAAKDANVVVLIVGETSDSSVESKDREDTALAAAQVALIHAVCAANPQTILVSNIGHAFDASWSDQAAAFVSAWYPGQGFGEALAQVLTGEVEPGGRLPVTLAARDIDYPAFALTPNDNGDLNYNEGPKIGYRQLVDASIRPRYAFGSGMGYTSFELLDAHVEGLDVTVNLRNSGHRRGTQVVQLYRFEPEFALVGFGKVSLDANETGALRIAIEPRLLRRWNDGWHKIGQDITIAVGWSSDNLITDVQVKL